MLYFDNAATSFPKPPSVAAAMGTFLAEAAANPGRAGHRLAVGAERMLEDVRLKLTRLFDGEDHRRMVFTLNCTDGLNMAIKGVLPDGGGAAHVVTTVLEHNSVSRPLQALADAGRIELTRVDCDDAGFVDPDDVRGALRADTALIVLTHASNVLGTIQDSAAVGAIARRHGALFLLDAAQTAGVVPISIRAMQVDLLAFPGHKSLLGPTGTGGLYVGPRCPEPAAGAVGGSGPAARRLRPWREGGTGGDSASPTQPAEHPHYLEGGTPNTVGIVGLGAAIAWLQDRDMSAIRAHEQRAVQLLLDRFGRDDRFVVYGTLDADRRVGTVSLGVGGLDGADVASILDDSFDIAVRAGLHCAPYTHRRLGTFPDGTVRISPGPFNDDDEVDALLTALDAIAG